MGGCRCSYKNCNIKSDGITHMFHYPVFDKFRCHQWLINAHKLDFLNLKLSQLKNRVVCQHHFKDDYFMNYKKDKLTFDAIPTLDGSYCDSSQYAETNEENIQSFPLILEEIENDNILYCDKRANYSVKYGDFLTNSEISFVTSLDTHNVNENLDYKSKYIMQENVDNEIVKQGNSTAVLENNPIKTKQMERYSDKLAFQPNTNSIAINSAEPEVTKSYKMSNAIQFSEETKPEVITADVKTESLCINIELSKNKPFNDNYVSSTGQDTTRKKESKVRILSEKKIKDPITIPKNLEYVSPSLVIKMPLRKDTQQKDSFMDLSAQPSLNNGESVIKPMTENYVVPLEFEPTLKQENIPQILNKETISEKVHAIQRSPKKQLCKPQLNMQHVKVLKKKICSQRIAAIQEKRKFNMKLRDMIQTCLDKKSPIKNEEQQVINYNVGTYENDNNKLKDNFTQIGSYLSQKPELPKAQEYTITNLEARMKRLENTLLNKIDQNTQKIIELKNCVTLTPTKKKNASVQTFDTDDSHKRHLYQEISKFLSPSSKSLVYEELFINKSLAKDTPGVKRKRRKCR